MHRLAILFAALWLAACSSAPLPAPEAIYPVRTGLLMVSPEVESRQIINLYNQGLYTTALERVRLWSQSDANRQLLFADLRVTTHALRLAADGDDRSLFLLIANDLPKPSSAVLEAYVAIGSANFQLLKRYMNCMLASRPPSVRPCETQLAEIRRLFPMHARPLELGPT